MNVSKAYDARGVLVSQRDDVTAEPEHSDTKLADLIEVTLLRGSARRYSLKIDGVELPWDITEDGVNLAVSQNQMPSVTVTILANAVRVVDEFID